MDFAAKRNRSVDNRWSKIRETNERRVWIYHYDVEGKRRYEYETIDIDQKHNRQFLGDEKIISCHWLKEIEDDSGVSASSFWFNGEKLINFSSTLATEAEFASGSFS